MTKEACNCNAVLYTVIIGSFRKHLTPIQRLKKELELRQISVLSPGEGAVLNPDDEFVIFSSDPVSHPKLLQDSVFAKVRRSTFIVLANIDGYLGTAALIEIGYAIALGIDIYAVEPVTNPHLIPYCKPLSDIFPDINLKLPEDQQNNWDSAYHSVLLSQENE